MTIACHRALTLAHLGLHIKQLYVYGENDRTIRMVAPHVENDCTTMTVAIHVENACDAFAEAVVAWNELGLDGCYRL